MKDKLRKILFIVVRRLLLDYGSKEYCHNIVDKQLLPAIQRHIDAEYVKILDLPTVEEIRGKYNELVFSVGKKWKDETRHQTALRYIKQSESNISSPSQILHARINQKEKK